MEKIRYKLSFCRSREVEIGEIILDLSQHKHKRRLHSRIYVKPSQWDSRRQMVVKHPLADDYNYYLMNLQLNLEQRELALWKAGKQPCLHDLLCEQKEAPRQEKKSFLQYARELTAHSAWKNSTRQNRLVSLDYWEQYIGDKSLQDICVNDVRRFLHHLREDKHLSNNTIDKHLRHLKIYANLLCKDYPDLAGSLPFDHIKVRTQNVERPHLNLRELSRLEQYAKRHQDSLLDAFLFCVYSGLRYSDFINLTCENIQREAQTSTCWLSFRMKKTGQHLRLPLHALFGAKALDILDKHQADLASFFHLPSNSSVNRHLKKVSALCALNASLSFHVARHTFATLLLQKGIQITVIQKLLGHANLRSTMTYAAVTEEGILSELQKTR